MPAGKGNPKGFWEDRDFVRVNEQILALRGFKWHHLLSTSDLFPAPGERDVLESKAITLIEARLAEFNLWGFKDPRTCRTLPFWNKILEDLSCEPLYVIAIRNPLSVADSLERRDDLFKMHSLLLWAEHTVGALKHTAGKRRVVVDYDLLMAEPIRELTRIATTLGLQEVTPENPKTGDYRDSFLERELRHSAYSLESLLADSDVPDFIKELYRELRSVAEDRLSLSDRKIQGSLERAEAELVASQSLVRAFNVLGESRRREISALRDENRKLAAGLAQERALNSERKDKLERIVGSKSWRITRPLRRVADLSKALAKRREKPD